VLNVALPTGRLLEPACALLARAGWPIAARPVHSRRLILEAGAPPVRFVMVKPSDVPIYVEYGIADAGIAGSDTLLESGADVLEPLDLGIGRCRLVVAGRESAAAGAGPDGAAGGMASTPDGAALRVATKYPRLTREHFHARGVHVEVVALGGSVELAPLLGLADRIVDLMETGRTLRDNGLVVLEEIAPVSARWIVNRARLALRRAEIGEMTRRLTQAVVAAGEAGRAALQPRRVAVPTLPRPRERR
jgi:ATP phosphoribosyltransferase